MLYADDLVDIKKCIRKSQNRRFELHRYNSKEEQPNNLEMRIEWNRSFELSEGSLSNNIMSQYIKLSVEQSEE
jgi:hypothetical protein